MAVPFNEWLDLIDGEYLRDFIVEGGSAVKFVVSNGAAAAAVTEKCRRRAREHGLFFAAVDSADVKLHLIQDVFFAVSRQTDWATDTQRFVEALCRSNGYEWPCPGQTVAITDLAGHNGVDETILKKEFNQWLTTKVMRDTGLAQDFRLAMTRLCLNRLVPMGESGETEAPILQWLRGELRLIGPLRAADIYSKITRHNARAMLRSLCRWLRLVGHKGLLLMIDIRRVTQSTAAGPDYVRYTPNAVMDAYEVLRQLIDDVDLFEGLFLVVVADHTFIGDDPKRSVSAYTALKMRIWDDVRARDRDNPLAPMVIVDAAQIHSGQESGQ